MNLLEGDSECERSFPYHISIQILPISVYLYAQHNLPCTVSKETILFEQTDSLLFVFLAEIFLFKDITVCKVFFTEIRAIEIIFFS